MTATSMESGVARFGNKSIDYRVERGRRTLTVAIVVDPIDGVVVRAPRQLERERIDAVVRRKSPWIVERMREFEDLLPAQASREFVSGETFLYLGRQYRLRVQADRFVDRARAALRDGRFVVVVPANIDEAERGGVVRAELRRWYRQRAAAYLGPRLQRWAAKLGIATPPMLIREPPKRWGSCDAGGSVRINWRTVQVAPRLIDYVLAHELVHLEYSRHDADFWSRLGEVIHDADARRVQLRVVGVRVNW